MVVVGVAAVVVPAMAAGVKSTVIAYMAVVAGVVGGILTAGNKDPQRDAAGTAMNNAAIAYRDGNDSDAERWLATVLAMPPAAAGQVRRREAMALLAMMRALSGRIAEARDTELALRDEGVDGELYADAVAGAVAFTRGRLDEAARFVDPIPHAIPGDLTKKRPPVIGVGHELWDATVALRRETWRRRGYPLDSLPDSAGPMVDAIIAAMNGVARV
jgi:hypothetical protein